MSLELCVLGSGSGGNATVIKTRGGVMLLDAGLGPRTAAKRLAGSGVHVEQIRSIVVTHLDHDHFTGGWFATIIKQGIAVHCHSSCVDGIIRRAEEAGAATTAGRGKFAALREWIVPFEGPFEPLPGAVFTPIHLAHDSHGTHGFAAEVGEHRLGFATDLGHVPDALIELFCGVDVLAIESNYDVEMEQNSSRPWYLKQRIMGGKGHLSNDQALAAVRAILDRTVERCGASRLPRHVVLLHRSRECNCPKLLRRVFEADARIKPRLVLTDQHEPTGWLRVRGETAAVGEVGQQMALGWGQ